MRRALLLSTALLLAACGGGDDEKSAYVEQANAVCEDARSEFEALEAPTTPDGFAPYAEQLVAVVEKAQTELEALTPPADDREELESRVLRPLAGLVDEGKQYVEQVHAAGGDQAKLLPLLSKRPSAAEIDTDYLREYGAETCAEAIEAAG
jgi:Tfp pilus assembly protein PilP